MDFNLTQLKDLEFICEIAEAYFDRTYGLEKEDEWLKRIRRYRQLLHEQIVCQTNP